MKHVILSADGDKKVYLVPDEVADNLEKYCLEFCTEWLKTSPHAEKYRRKIGNVIGVCYNESDFIEYLNSWVFPEQVSTLVEVIGPFECEDIPEKYADVPYYNF